jgi:hypothetical protein
MVFRYSADLPLIKSIRASGMVISCQVFAMIHLLQRQAAASRAPQPGLQSVMRHYGQLPLIVKFRKGEARRGWTAEAGESENVSL